MSDLECHHSKVGSFDWKLNQEGQVVADRPYSVPDPAVLTRGNTLPISRVKKIMKEGEHPGMIAADAPVLLAKACEMLIKDLTLQSWDCTLTTRRCTLQRQDVISAIFKNHIYSFLLDMFSPEVLYPKMELKSDKYVLQLNSVKQVNNRINCPLIQGCSAPRGCYQRNCISMDHSPLPVSTYTTFQGGAPRYVLNTGVQGHVVNPLPNSTMQVPTLPRINKMMCYTNMSLKNNHMVNSGYIAKMPRKIQGNTKSQTLIKKSTPYCEVPLTRSIQGNRVQQSQISYSQQRFAVPNDHSRSQGMQNHF